MEYTTFVKQFDVYLQDFVQLKIKTHAAHHKHLRQTLTWLMRTLLSQGKRIRPYMVFVGYGSVKKIDSKLFRTAVAVELLHLFALIHDDIIDRAETRRHFPTMHAYIAGKTPHAQQKEHTGLSLSLLVGDLLLSWAYDAAKMNNGIVQEFQDTVEEVIVGQYHEVAVSDEFPTLQKKEILNIAIQKSGRYTMLRPFQLGRLAAGGKGIVGFDQFADCLGLAFQLQDDLLGVFGNERETGKSVCSDIQEGKPTLLAWYAFRHARAKEKKRLNALYGNRVANKKNCNEVKKIFLLSGAKERVMQDARSAFVDAENLLQTLHLPRTTTQQLRELIDRLQQRVS